jgi:hypothetical protein
MFFPSLTTTFNRFPRLEGERVDDGDGGGGPELEEEESITMAKFEK